MKTTDIILILLQSDYQTPVVGTTRLQKLAFLIENEEHVKADDKSFEFIPQKFGPASKSLYDDIEFLVNIGFVEKSGEDSHINEVSLDAIASIDPKDLLDNTPELDITADDNEKKDEDEEKEDTTKDDSIVYRITEKGIKYLQDNSFLRSTEASLIDKVKKRYGKKSLIDLLKYVYLKYPKFASDSEIRDRIL